VFSHLIFSLTKLYDNISEEEYGHAQKAWEAFGRNISDHSDLYVTTDELLLADVSKNFRKVCREKYGLDPAHYCSSPGLSWDGSLKKDRCGA